MNLRKAWFTLVQVGYDLFLKLNPRKLAAHAVMLDEYGRVLLLRSRYADVWSLPGGGLSAREHLNGAVLRECREELGVNVAVEALTGMYFAADTRTYIGIFRCHVQGGAFRLSHEHSEMLWAEPAEVPERWREMVRDALAGGERTAVKTLFH